jgi:hypothetical protein
MLHALRSRSAESLIETLIAITVIVMSTTAALGLIRNAMTGNEVIGEKMIAINLSMEALEGLRNLRDTNYLRFPGREADCWNAFNVEIADDCESSFNKISGAQTYYIERVLSDGGTNRPLMSWDLEVEMDPEGENSYVDLYHIEGSPTGLLPVNLDLYAQSGLANQFAGIELVRERAFKRSITVSYDAEELSYDATVTVSWNVDGQSKSLSLTRTIAHSI